MSTQKCNQTLQPKKRYQGIRHWGMVMLPADKVVSNIPINIANNQIG